MSAQHTPGPWWITNSGVRDGGGYICHTNPASHYEGQDERFAQETAERAANKFLIAAAPDMLAELRHFVRFHDQIQPHDIERAKALIAKAEGGAL